MNKTDIVVFAKSAVAAAAVGAFVYAIVELLYAWAG